MAEYFDFGDGAGPVPAHRHPNGRGWVADSATVAPSAYVGLDAHVRGSVTLDRFMRVRAGVVETTPGYVERDRCWPWTITPTHVCVGDTCVAIKALLDGRRTYPKRIRAWGGTDADIALWREMKASWPSWRVG